MLPEALNIFFQRHLNQMFTKRSEDWLCWRIRR